eukprot:TRINITY_DN2674_c0_g1_i1.p1 TRINITY_DN2674_c0_g1~~TRINITY_DN2674_c0_g1_i1.p1  ORF type:complete len:211 (+),score=72.27 TRINITY_DN2674_c0_g1_i1:22-654(+)
MAEFQDGLWKGSFKIDGKEISCYIDLKFRRQQINGNGMDEFSFFTIEGTFEQIRPFRANFERLNSDGKKFICSGFKEIKEKGGIFGESTDEKSQKKENFVIRPVEYDQKIMEQIKSKQNGGMKQKLLFMGFDEYEIEKALSKHDNLNSAIEYLSNGGGFHSDSHSSNKEVQVDEGKIQQIICMGFSREESINALKIFNNDVEQAINSLLG